MGSGTIQLLILAGIALFLILRLKDVLGTREGFEPKDKALGDTSDKGRKARFDVIEGGGEDHDITNFTEADSDDRKALVEIKKAESGFMVADFISGARQAYEWILMAYETGDRETLKNLLIPEVYEGFEAGIAAREAQGFSIDAKFIGIRDLKIKNVQFDRATNEADISVDIIGELISVVKDQDGNIVEGDPKKVRRQKDIWTFTRKMGSDDPTWFLAATGE